MNSVSAPKIPLDAFDSSRCSVPYPWPVAGRWRADDTALLAIDMQKDFLDPRGYFASLGESLEHTRRSVAPAGLSRSSGTRYCAMLCTWSTGCG